MSVIYDPGKNTAARRLIESQAPEILIEGPAGTGKSLAVWHKLNLICMKHPNVRCLAVRKVRSSMTETVLVTFERDVCSDRQKRMFRCHELSRGNRGSYDYSNGSSIVIAGLDRADRIMSGDYDVIAVFEATEITEEEWEYLSSRLRSGQLPGRQQIIADCNPSHAHHWLNMRFRDSQGGRRERLHSKHEDNPILYDADKGEWTERGKEYIKVLDSFTGHMKQRLRYGKWCSAEGLVYGDYDPSIHEIERHEVPDIHRLVWGVDFGTVHAFSGSLWGTDHDGRLYRLRQIYGTANMYAGETTLVDDHAKRMNAIQAEELPLHPLAYIEGCVCDHQAQERLTLERFGHSTILADKADLVAGLNRVRARLRPAPDGRPRIFFVKDALDHRDDTLAALSKPWNTEMEFSFYMYPKKPNGQLSEKPLKMYDDGMDEMRYVVTYFEDEPVQMAIPASSHGTYTSDRGVW